jgi:hypothetical protein
MRCLLLVESGRKIVSINILKNVKNEDNGRIVCVFSYAQLESTLRFPKIFRKISEKV